MLKEDHPHIERHVYQLSLTSRHDGKVALILAITQESHRMSIGVFVQGRGSR